MIVCWLVFGLSVAIAAYLWSEVDGHQETVMIYFDAIENHPAMALELPDPRYESVEDEDGRTIEELLRLQKWVAKDRKRVLDRTESVMRFAMYTFFWIIACHIGRGLWMERKFEFDGI